MYVTWHVCDMTRDMYVTCMWRDMHVTYVTYMWHDMAKSHVTYMCVALSLCCSLSLFLSMCVALSMCCCLRVLLTYRKQESNTHREAHTKRATHIESSMCCCLRVLLSICVALFAHIWVMTHITRIERHTQREPLSTCVAFYMCGSLCVCLSMRVALFLCYFV